MTRLTLLAIAWFVGLALAAWRLPGYFHLLVGFIGLLMLSFLGRCFKVAPLILLIVAGLAALRLWLADWRPAVELWQALYNDTVTVVGIVDDEPSTLTGQVAVRVRVEGVQANNEWVYFDGQWLTGTTGWPPGDPRGTLCPWWPALCYPAPRIQLRVNADQLPLGQAAELFRYGHRVRIDGKLTRAPNFDLFPYRETLARQGVYGLIRTQRVELLDTDPGWRVRRTALDWRAEAARVIDQLMPDQNKEAGLLKGILLGREEDLPTETIESLRRTSLTHIIVVSGYNITILIAGWYALMNLLRGGLNRLAVIGIRKKNYGLTRLMIYLQYRTLTPSRFPWLTAWFFIIFYVFFVGLGPSPVRAAIMGMTYVLARYAGRPYGAFHSLTVVAWGMTLVDPWVFLDIGFQLSVMATLGLIVLAPIIDKNLARQRRFRYQITLREIVSTTLAASLMTAPIISYYFGQVSIIGLLANILVLPAQPLVMFLGGPAVISGAIASQIDRVSATLHGSPFWFVVPWRDWLFWLAQHLATLAWVPLAWSSLVAERLSLAPWSTVDTRASLPIVVGFYIALGYSAYLLAVRVGLAPWFTPLSQTPVPQQSPAPAPASVPSPTPRPTIAPPFAPQPTVAFAERAGRPVWRRGRRPVHQAPMTAPLTNRDGPPVGGIGSQPLEPMSRLTPSTIDTSLNNTRPIPCWVATLLQPWRAGAVVVVMALAWGVVSVVSAQPDRKLHITVLPSGETVVAQTPNGYRLVIGGGAWTSETMTALDQNHLPWDRRIEAIAATRTERQYLENLTPLFGHYFVSQALAPPRPRTTAGFVWDKAVEDTKPGATTYSEPTRLTLSDGVILDIVLVDKVQNATLYSLSWGEVRFILAGGLRNPINMPETPADVILVSSQIRDSLLKDLLNKTSPTVVIVQSDGNELDEPSRTFSPSLTVYTTNEAGQITLTTDGQRLWVETER